MNSHGTPQSFPASLRQRLALWVGIAALIGGVIGFLSSHSFRGTVGGLLLGPAIVLVASWIDRLIVWLRRVIRVARGTLVGLSVGAILGAVLAVVRKQGWLGPMFGGGALGALIGMFIAVLIEQRRAAPPVPPASQGPPSWPPNSSSSNLSGTNPLGSGRH